MLAQDIFHHTILTSHVYLDLIDVFVAHVSILNLLFFILNIILPSSSVLYIFVSFKLFNTSLFGCPYLLFLPTLITEYLGLT